MIPEQNINSVSQTINGNTMITTSQINSLQEDGSIIIGDDTVFDFWGLSQGFEGVRDTNLIGSDMQIY